MKKTLLSNRYGDKNYLIRAKHNLYKLYISLQSADYCCVSYNDDEALKNREYCSVDPSGGPYIRIGTTLYNYKIVTRIYGEIDNENHETYCIQTRTSYKLMFNYYMKKFRNLLKKR